VVTVIVFRVDLKFRVRDCQRPLASGRAGAARRPPGHGPVPGLRRRHRRPGRDRSRGYAWEPINAVEGNLLPTERDKTRIMAISRLAGLGIVLGRPGCSAMAQLLLVGGPIIAGAVAGAYKAYSAWLDTERGKQDMRIKFGVVTLDSNVFRSQMTRNNEIGKGSSGTVYKCLIPVLSNHNYFAVKWRDAVERSHANEGSSDRTQGFRELEILAACRHPNIVRVVAVAYECSNLVLIYPFVAGGSLEERLESSAVFKLTSKQRIGIALNLLDAVIYLHSALPDKPFILHRSVLVCHKRDFLETRL
jgi:hypothetical protein